MALLAAPGSIRDGGDLSGTDSGSEDGNDDNDDDEDAVVAVVFRPVTSTGDGADWL